ncbi:papilin-like isoform X2 [Littorina saxatilis]
MEAAKVFVLCLCIAVALGQANDFGMWGDWGEPSACSRTCGSGVLHRTRKCHHGIPGVSRGCQGDDIVYESCNTQACPDGLESFRSVQCRRFNSQRNTWVPYKDDRQPCALVCQSKEEPDRVTELQERVVDGTECDLPDSLGICLRGVCKEVGCDRRIDSTMREDRCLVCGGRVDTCQTVSTSINEADLKTGVNDMATIPLGSSSILITVHHAESGSASLVLSDRNGKMYMDERSPPADDTVFTAAGAPMRYRRSTTSNGYVTVVKGRGPTNDTLLVKLNYRDQPTSAEFEYSIPKNRVLESNPNQPYTWIHGAWTSCSQECGPGYQLRAVSCIDRSSGASVDDSQCDQADKPDLREECNVKPCGTADNWYRWVPGHWGKCSVHCGVGEQTQEMYCVETGQSGDTVYVKEELCERYSDKHPVYKRACEGDGDECPYWANSAWAECSVTCGYGTQSRQVYCQRDPADPTSVPVTVDDSLCTLEQPDASMVCRLDPCPDGSNWARPGTVEVEDSKDCEDSQYGCCADGVTAASGHSGMGCPNTNSTINECLLEPERGRCADFKIWWHYNPQDRECQRFWYGGCQGNQNRYKDEKECKAKCLPGGGKETPVAGDCTSRAYGCCPDGKTPARGANNEGCPGSVSPTTDRPCRRSRFGCCSDGVTEATGPNQQGCSSGTDSKKCQQSYYGCCDGTDIPASGPNQQGCRSPVSGGSGFDAASCSKPQDRGSCFNYSIQWFYDTSEDPPICKRFWYGGCGGNPNRFDTEEQCQQGCINAPKLPELCNLPAVVGPCRARHPRFFFNGKVGKCQRFFYGGCRGNENRFRSVADCESTCGGSGAGETKNRTANEIAPSNKVELCSESRYGCCRDRVKAAGGPNYEGCGEPCQASRYGCCEDGVTAAQGRNKEGCTETGSGDYGDCEETRYGCCPDGVTAASGPNQRGCSTPTTTTTTTTTTARPPIAADRCSKPSDRGPCSNWTVRWHFDSASQDAAECKQFWYGGCQGNDNRFETRDDCEADCIATEAPATDDPDFVNICDMPRESGPCRGSLPRWYYDPLDRQCRNFYYSGCRGNENNFLSLPECQQTCMGIVPTAAPTTTTTTTPAPYTFNPPPTSSSLTMEGSDKVLEGSELRLTCKAEGPSTPTEIEWFINGKRIGREQDYLSIRSFSTPTDHRYTSELTISRSQKDNTATYYCRSIPYSDVERKTVVVSKTLEVTTTERPDVRPVVLDRTSSDPETVCKMPQQTGSCRAYFQRWFYDVETKRCRQFVYGGCNGNSNNFETKKDCMDYCQRDEPTPDVTVVTDVTDVCLLKEEPGNCRANFQRYYYNAQQGQCLPFTYGGCDGNSNNFETAQDCNDYCRTEDICKQPQVVGPCRAGLTRYYYDSATMACRQFFYGGCQGNLNNFGSLEYCQQKCASHGAVDTPRTKAVCTLNPDAGTCRGYNISWYYDSTVERCQRFVWTGCEGNGNRFSTEDECIGYCGPSVDTVVTPAPTQSTGDVCTMPSDRGTRCREYEIFWYHDSSQGGCTRFYYGGCGGNDNRFTSQAECEQRCVNRPAETTTRAPRTRACAYGRYGCCPDAITPAIDAFRTNCGEDSVVVRPSGDGNVVLANRGSTAILECYAPGSASSWYRDGYYLTSDSRFHIHNNGTLVIRDISDDIIGNYACRIADGNNIPRIQRYEVKLKVPLSILQAPPTISVGPGDNAYLHCQAFGTPKPTVAWTHESSPVYSGARNVVFNNGTLMVTSVIERDTGNYKCTAENGVDSPVFREVQLLIARDIVAKIQSHSGTIMEGETARLSCDVSGYPTPSVTWQKEGVPVTSGSGKVYIQGNTLVVPRVGIDDSGLYACIADNAVGSARDLTYLQVKPMSHREKCVNTMSKMKCRLIVSANLCGHRMFSRRCCESCRQAGLLIK